MTMSIMRPVGSLDGGGAAGDICPDRLDFTLPTPHHARPLRIALTGGLKDQKGTGRLPRGAGRGDAIQSSRRDPASLFALLEREKLAIDALLFISVKQWRVMCQRAPIPVERRIDIRARAHVIEPTRGAVRQKHIQPIGWPWPPPDAP